jgi:hypothetical protein
VNTVLLYGLVGVIVIFAIWLGFRYARKAGAFESVAKGRGKVIKNVDKAKRAVDRLDSDPDYRDELRDRRSRD